MKELDGTVEELKIQKFLGNRKLNCVEEDLVWKLRNTRSDLMQEIKMVERIATDTPHTPHPKQ